MAIAVLSDVRILVGEMNLSPKIGTASISYGAELQDVTNLGGMTTRGNKAGLKTATVAVDGYYDPDGLDADQFPKVGATALTYTVMEPNAVDTTYAIAYFGDALYADLEQFGAVGDVTPFSATLQGNNLGKGYTFLDLTATATGTSNGQQLGAIENPQKVLVAIHVLTVSGSTPTLDITVQSDDNSGFTSATSRATSNQFTAAGSQYIEVAPPITDDYWRIAYTIGGTAPSFTFAVSMARQV